MDIHKCVLDNGLRVLSVERPGFKGAQITLALRAGSRRETKRTNGIAHFLEHIFFGGGVRYPTQRETTGMIEGYGGYTNAFTSRDIMYFETLIPVDMVGTGIDVLSDMLLNATFRNEIIEKERGPIVEEIASYEDMPSDIANELFLKSLYGDTPMGWPVTGPEKNVKRFMRDDFVAFRSAMYNAQDAVLAIVGDTPHHEAFSLAHKYFVDMPDTSSGHLLEDARPMPIAGPKVTIRQKNSAQAAIILGMPAPDYFAEDRLESAIANIILGGGMSSRLFQNVRSEKGLAYSVGSSYENSVDHGEFVCGAGVNPEKVDETLAAILSELKRLQDDPVGVEELVNAKRQRSGRLSMTCDSSSNIAYGLAGTELLYQEAKTPYDVVHEADDVTAEGIQLLAQKLFVPRNMHLAVVGPYKGNAKTLKSILTA